MNNIPVQVYVGPDKIPAEVKNISHGADVLGVSVVSRGVQQLALNKEISEGFQYQSAFDTVADLLEFETGQRLNDAGELLERLTWQDYPAFEQTLINAGIDPQSRHQALILKQIVDDAKAVGTEQQVEAVLCYLAGADGCYNSLLYYLNHILSNAGSNPRFSSDSSACVQTLDEIKAIELWAIKEGDTTVVFLTQVLLQDGQEVRFVINVSQDATHAAQATRTAYTALLRYYKQDPECVMEPYGCGEGITHLIDGSAVALTILIGEWIDGDELHLYADTGTRFHVWREHTEHWQQPLSQHESDVIWQEIVSIQVRLSRFDQQGAWIPQVIVNGGDFIKPHQPDAGPAILIWIRDEAFFTDPASLVVNGLLQWGLDSPDGRYHYLWWDNPELAIQAVSQGLLTASERRGKSPHATIEQLRQLWQQAYHQTLPALLKDATQHLPQSLLLNWGGVPEAQCPKMRAVIRHAHTALAGYL